MAIGVRVTFLRAATSQVIDIVGHDESDPAANRLAFTAPLVRALIGSEVGDEVEAPGDGGMIEITAIEPIPDNSA